jgi:hypothetical protein
MDELQEGPGAVNGGPTDPKHTANPSPPKSRGGLTEALSAWDAECGAQAPSPLEAIRLDANERIVIPFTTSMQRVETHYVDFPSLQGYVRCPGDACLLCRVGRRREQRDLLPVYDPIARAVGVLAISPNIRPHALRPQLMPILRQLKAGQRVLFTVRKTDRTGYAVASRPLLEGADDGAEKVVGFLERFDAGGVELAAVYAQPSSEELANIPEVAAMLKLRGITS